MSKELIKKKIEEGHVIVSEVIDKIVELTWGVRG
jgi:hypothetical protein